MVHAAAQRTVVWRRLNRPVHARRGRRLRCGRHKRRTCGAGRRAVGQPHPHSQPGQHHRRQSEDYTVAAYETNGQDAYGRSFDVTGSAILTIAPDGSCTANACTATTAGPHTVTGTITYEANGDIGTATGTASLDVQPGPPVTVTLAPNPPISPPPRTPMPRPLSPCG
jgi:hypothetical protein